MLFVDNQDDILGNKQATSDGHGTLIWMKNMDLESSLRPVSLM